MLFQLLVGHALMDFALQGGAMAQEKSYKSKSQLQKDVPWYYWLTAHALLHGGAVMYITGSLGLGVLETVLHWFIDLAKVAGLTNIHTDQLLHVLCKVGIWWIVMRGWTHHFEVFG